ncbi:unnamed protein product [Diatraea saccharalis]|uniref:Uncharacterized protein n=1 Tax=Diatraea saccharalis TaxID=40085 RepID=A0A9N9QVB7_9NEOP|nr:unnamed protein product [Diatraea saccharalis]
MDKKANGDGRPLGPSRRARRDRTPDLSPDPSNDSSLIGLRVRCHSSAAVREIASNPATHGSATRQVVSGKVFKKCKSATFQIDGATYTIEELDHAGVNSMSVIHRQAQQ